MILLNKFINYQHINREHGFYKYRLIFNNKNVLLSSAKMVGVAIILNKKDSDQFIERTYHNTYDIIYLSIKIYNFKLEFYYDIISSITHRSLNSSYKILYLPSTKSEIEISQIVKEYQRVLLLG